MDPGVIHKEPPPDHLAVTKTCTLTDLNQRPRLPLQLPHPADRQDSVETPLPSLNPRQKPAAEDPPKEKAKRQPPLNPSPPRPRRRLADRQGGRRHRSLHPHRPIAQFRSSPQYPPSPRLRPRQSRRRRRRRISPETRVTCHAIRPLSEPNPTFR